MLFSRATNGTPSHTVSVLEGMKAEFSDAKITYVPGTQFLSNQGATVPASVFTTPNGKPGLKAECGSRPGFDAKTTPLTSRVESNVSLTEGNLPEEARETKTLAVQWTGFLNPSSSGDYLLGIKADGFVRVSLDDKVVTAGWGNDTHLGQVHLEKGHPLKLNVSYSRSGERKPQAQLMWAPVNNAPDLAAVAAAKNADVVIVVVGITSRLEGEEMPVNLPGFLGGDRTSLDLPQPEEDLVQAVVATGKRSSSY